MIIAPRDFRDEEYTIPREYLEKLGAKITVGCSSTEEAIGRFGMKVTPDTTLDKIWASEFDAIIFVGGQGALNYLNDYTALTLARKGVEEKKVVTAICVAPLILGAAGILTNKKATIFPQEASRLSEFGALYTAKSVEREDKIITAQGPEVALEFARQIAKAMME